METNYCGRGIMLTPHNNRGITPIISVILLLMMTVGIAGFAWVWLQSVTTGIMDTTKNMTDAQLQQMMTNIVFVDYSLECNSTHILNVTLLMYNRGGTTAEIRTALVEGNKVSAQDLQQGMVLTPGMMEGIKISNAGKYFRGLNKTSTTGGKVILTTGQGFITQTLAISGDRCPQS